MQSIMMGRLAALRQRVAAAAASAGRRPADVELLAVSKGHPVPALRQALDLGLTKFGESYVSEAMPKVDGLQTDSVEWVYLGPIQTNKTRPIAENFDWVLGLSTLSAARRLHAQRPDNKGPLNICVQVNIDGDPAKSGLRPELLDAFLDELDQFGNLTVRGLMTITRRPEPGAGGPGAAAFAALADLFAKQVAGGRRWDTLSMGMSGDFEAAIASGSTQVRLGTALFGPRPARVPDTSANEPGESACQP
ncbi:YggS family pyridoxal phosphate-dependent enzyme [Micromonospora sp. NPDC048999]|uniref:YggS family pyridoxal phosphate-dependent enzyme n=1 Tax=Micromonospora sp. NPDC048999 TaxID=3155391 RepID=UPI0033DCECE9